jgi:hypothetical protein
MGNLHVCSVCMHVRMSGKMYVCYELRPFTTKQTHTHTHVCVRAHTCTNIPPCVADYGAESDGSGAVAHGGQGQIAGRDADTRADDEPEGRGGGSQSGAHLVRGTPRVSVCALRSGTLRLHDDQSYQHPGPRIMVPMHMLVCVCVCT